MKAFFESKAGKRVIALLWTFTTCCWTVTFTVRLSRPYEDESLLMLTLMALLASLAACIANWVRYARFEEKTENEE